MSEFDKIILIRGEIFSREFVALLKKTQPKAEFIMYQWDSSSHLDYTSLIDQFDKVKTFDFHDKNEFSIDYLPLFYIDEYTSDNNERRGIDIFFCGSFHSDRLKVIKYFRNNSSLNDISFECHLFIPFFSFASQLIKGNIKFNDLKYLSFKKLSHSTIKDFYCRSKSVLDIELDTQTGLSIRTFESLASGCKLITTNHNVVSEPLYSKDKIEVIKRDDLIFPIEFIQGKDNGNIDMKAYSLSSWVDKLLH
jgi:hypothetical protein